MKVLLATNHPAIENIVEKLESKAGIRELEKSLQEYGLSQWAMPITIVDEAKYREAVIDRARLTKPDVILLYDKLPGTIELDLLIEELRLEIRNENGKDTRVIFLTSLAEGAKILRKAVEIGIWDIISGKDIMPIEIIRRIYEPCNYSDVAHFKLAGDMKNQVKFVPRYIEKEKIIEVSVEKEVRVKEIVKEKEYVRIGNGKGIKETILVWSPYETGKTFVAVNLAVALSRKGLKTVLIDTDLENSSLHTFFDMKKAERYAYIKCLKERSDAETVLNRAFKYNKNLYVLSLPIGKAEIPETNDEEFALLYDGLRRECDIFVIDSCRNLESPLSKSAFKLASCVILPVTQDANRASAIRVKLKELVQQGIPLNKFELILNMAVKINSPIRTEIEEIMGMKILAIEIPAVLETAYKCISEGVPPYDDKTISELFIYSVNSLANHLNGDEYEYTSQKTQKKPFRLFR
ncbi:MAG: hypothetical protein CVU87_11620 [Firmicutes bacterium HGW-Firmicutes-12]|jgi:cellulose biosynthesis protein BcsQ/DNA-binding NarL/FixJ family response regulator|nr:MAG: hypothetical protein CVU87_11620 [Firmicutes bacterium HGW-Firmicutes-12]